MFDKNALNDKWIEAAEAWRVYEEASQNSGYEHQFRECDHPRAKRKADGTRDKRSGCYECEREALDAVHTCNVYGMEWSKVWDLFEAIGMSVKRKETAGV